MPATRLRRLIGEPNSEVELTTLRCTVGVAIVVYLAICDLRERVVTAPEGWRIVPLVYIALAFILAWITRRDIGIQSLRRGFGMVLDLGSGSAMLAMLGESAVFLYGGFFWVTIGYGFRFGVGALFVSQAIAIAGLIGAYMFGPYWQAHPTLSAGLLAGIVIVPPYFAVFVTRLRDSQRRLQEANQAKSRFLAKMSHEIRTPLNGILGACQLLRPDHDAKQSELVRIINESSRNLRALLDDVLDLAKIEAGRMTTEAVAFPPEILLRSVMDIFAAQATERSQRHALEVTGLPASMIGDARHLRQVLINLVGNAVKFTPEGGRITVTARAATTDTGEMRLRVEVQDNGPGIDPKIQSHLFEAFVQADDSMTRQHGGAGLGTTIAHELVQLMRGKIGFESRPGDTRFWFEIPLRVPTTPEAGATAADARAAHELTDHSLAGLRVLIADDQPANCLVLMRALELAGATVSEANSGVDALRLLSEQHFHIAVLDIHMPDLDGIAVLRQHRARSGSVSPPIAMLSADVTLETRAEALAAGAVAVWSKPVLCDELATEVARIVEPPSRDPVIDHEKLEDLASIGESYRARTIARLLDDADERPRVIRAAIDRADWLAARQGVHALLGSMLLIGAPRTVRFLRDTSARIKARELIDGATFEQAFAKHIEDVRSALAKAGIRWTFETRARDRATSQSTRTA